MSTVVLTSSETVRSVPLFAYPLAATVIVTSLHGAGFTAASQALLVVLTGLTVLAAALSDRSLALAVVRSPLVWVLGLLGVLSVLSAAWTVSSPRDAARWGLVILAYAALAACGAQLVARAGVWPVAGGLALLAAIEAVLGLRATALHAAPDAEWFNAGWRPGGSFQYPPALGLLEVAALPALLAGLGRARLTAAMAAAGAVLAGATLGSADSRLDLGLAAVVLGVALLRPHTRNQRRRETFAAVAVISGGALAGHLVLGRHASATENGGGVARLILIGCVCAALAAAWLPIRTLLRRHRRPWAAMGALAAVTAAVIAAAAAIGPAGAQQPQPYPLATSVTARIHLWNAALEAWRDRPLVGAGTGAYYQASAKYQGPHPSIFAHNLPLELAAELGMLGLLLGISLYAAAIDLLRRARSSPELWLLGPAVAAFLIANLVDWPWHLAGLGAAWAVAAGGLIAADRLHVARQASSNPAANRDRRNYSPSVTAADSCRC